jgi:hypothetical protein
MIVFVVTNVVSYLLVSLLLRMSLLKLVLLVSVLLLVSLLLLTHLLLSTHLLLLALLLLIVEITCNFTGLNILNERQLLTVRVVFASTCR